MIEAPSWKAKKLGKRTQAKVLLEPCSRFANSIRPFAEHTTSSPLLASGRARYMDVPPSSSSAFKRCWYCPRLLHHYSLFFPKDSVVSLATRTIGVLVYRPGVSPY